MVVNLVRRRAALVTTALGASAALALAGCGSSGGGQDQYALSGSAPSSSTAAHSSAASGTHSAARSSSDAPSTHAGGSHQTAVGGGGHPTVAGGGGGGGGGNGGGGSHITPPASTCATSTTPGAVITVCPATGLHSGQKVKITGHGFTPSGLNGRNLIYTECRYLGENANNYGSDDCTINTSDLGASSTTSDANGNVGPVYLTVEETFKKINCATQKCLVSVAPPLLANNNDQPHVLISFG